MMRHQVEFARELLRDPISRDHAVHGLRKGVQHLPKHESIAMPQQMVRSYVQIVHCVVSSAKTPEQLPYNCYMIQCLIMCFRISERKTSC